MESFIFSAVLTERDKKDKEMKKDVNYHKKL